MIYANTSAPIGKKALPRPCAVSFFLHICAIDSTALWMFEDELAVVKGPYRREQIACLSGPPGACFDKNEIDRLMMAYHPTENRLFSVQDAVPPPINTTKTAT